MSRFITNSAAAMAAIFLTVISFNALIISPTGAEGVFAVAPVLA